MTDHTSDENATKKRKRKNNNNRNPLAQARGKQQSLENIWFRRTGAGFHLFVQYYAGQTVGTVATKTSEASKASILEKTVTASKQTAGAGLSRAAKRRKKKKKQNQNAQTDHDNDHEDNPTPQTPQEATILTTVNPTHPLFTAMKTTAETYPNAISLLTFLNSMSQPLPVTFRIRRSVEKDSIQQLQTKISQQFPNLVQPLPFGNNLLYQASCSKADLKQHPALKQFLVDGSLNGTIARQELGSMLPLLALEAAGCMNHKARILDTCASPGSKTLQALEYNRKSRILANDVSESRLQALRDAIQRSGMPHLDRIGYSCQDARHLTSSKLWDIIVCDVPCSGDGTVRKDPHILELWKPEQGQALHTLQLQILLRALALIKPGGTVCYSTCSLNPVENEAVVAAALKQYNDTAKSKACEEVELLEFPTIAGFQRRPGVSTWRVADYREVNVSKEEGDDNDDDDDDDEIPRLVWYDSFEDAKQAGMQNAVETFWPPSDRDWKELERCTRLWPQDHDSGGFFLSLLRKVK